MPELYAHTPPPGKGWEEGHLLTAHLVAVAEMARGFAGAFGAGELAYWLGLWHDLGKCNPAFQEYLRLCHADPKTKRRGPDHKAAGASVAQQHAPPLALLVQGHHGGLKNRVDYQTWFADRQKDVVGSDRRAIDVSLAQARQLLSTLVPAQRFAFPSYLSDPVKAEFFLRMLFSTLVDADVLDTEAHWTPDHAAQRSSSVTLAELWQRFEHDQQRFSGTSDTIVGQARHAMYQACLHAAEQPQGLFRLAMPTGGGKTRSAMAFALRHAVQHGHKRVIVAVPFISITEQTAAVYRALFHAEERDAPVVLEHHSSADAQRSEADDLVPSQLWSRLAAENWDAPIVVTTTVQLFESVFSNKTSRCRKLHRLANSVIILDEAQALPPHLLAPILDGLRELCAHYNTTVVLSTATQPAFETISAFANLHATDIVPDAARWFAALKRVQYDWRVDQPLAWSDITELMRDEPQVLVVVNTKPDALALLDTLDDPDVLHLSTLLCGAHRRDVIAAVKQRLQQGAPCRLVSTQVIEAGVDLDFPLVLRALGPLDSIIQAAGRCNREGRLEHGRVIVFNPAAGRVPKGAYTTATDITRAMLGTGTLDPDNPDDARRYFRQLFDTVELDREGIQKLRKELDYPEVARRFRMIKDDTEDVIVLTYGDEKARDRVERDVEHLRRKLPGARGVLRRLQPYLVAIRKDAAQRYQRQNWIEPLQDGLGIWRGQYDAVRGLVADDDRESMIF